MNTKSDICENTVFWCSFGEIKFDRTMKKIKYPLFQCACDVEIFGYEMMQNA